MKPINKPIKRLSLYLFLLFFTLQTPSLADDISDFQIEGISLGDSLLDYFSEEEIKNNIKVPSFKNKKYVPLYVENIKTLDNYNYLSVWVKDKDKKYIIYSVEGYLNIKKSLQDCYKKQKEIIKDLNEFFEDMGIKDDGLRTRKHTGDKSGKSTFTETLFKFPDGNKIQITCMDYGKNVLGKDSYSLSIAIDSKEYSNFLKNEAW